jgi:exosortase N
MKFMNPARVCKSPFLLRYKEQLLLFILILSYIIIVVRFLSGYFITDGTVWAALILSFYIVKPGNEKSGRIRYLVLSLIMILSAVFTGVKTFYFFSIGLAILFGIESFFGPVGYLPLFLLGLLSPTFKFFNNMLGFPVRLQLSEWSGNLLMVLGYQVEVKGNVLVLNGAEFSVDPACVGLKMMAISLLAGLFIMAYFQRQGGRPFHFVKITMILVAIIVFNIACNLVRIMLLTLFQLFPSNPAHETVGIVCFLIYIILPSYFVIRWSAKRYPGHDRKSLQPKTRMTRGIVLNGILLACIVTIGFTRFSQPDYKMAQAPESSWTGYSREVVKGDVLKLEKPGILIYIKPIQSFYCAEHSPMICWVGSGYKFDRFNKQVIGNAEIYTGILSNGTDRLYTAWWFDNGTYRTSSQVDFRWRTLKGDNFNLINVTAEKESDLLAEINKHL